MLPSRETTIGPYRYSSLKALYFPAIDFRQGHNLIQVTNESTSKSVGWLEVECCSFNDQEIKVFGWNQNSKDSNLYIYGETKPGSTVEFRYEDSYVVRGVSDDSTGFFKAKLYLDKMIESETIKVSLAPFSPGYFSNGSNTWEGASISKIEDDYLFGKISIVFKEDLSSADIFFDAKLPESEYLNDLIDSNQITSKELAFSLFKFGVIKGDASYFDFYDVNYSEDGPEYDSPLTKANHITQISNNGTPTLNERELSFAITVHDLKEGYQDLELGFFEQPFLDIKEVNAKRIDEDLITLSPDLLMVATYTISQDIPTYTIKEIDFSPLPYDQKSLIKIERNAFPSPPDSEGEQSLPEEIVPENNGTPRGPSLVSFLARLQSSIPSLIRNVISVVFQAVPFIALLYLFKRYNLNETENQGEGETLGASIKNIKLFAVVNVFFILHMISVSGGTTTYPRYSSLKYVLVIFISLLMPNILYSYQRIALETIRKSILKNLKLIFFSALLTFLIQLPILILFKTVLPTYFPEINNNLRSWLLLVLGLILFNYVLISLIYTITSVSVGRWLSMKRVIQAYLLTIFVVALPQIIISLLRLYGSIELNFIDSEISFYLPIDVDLSSVILLGSSFLPRYLEIWILLMTTTAFSALFGYRTLLVLASLNQNILNYIRNHRKAFFILFLGLCFPLGRVTYASVDRSLASQLPRDLASDHIISMLPYLLLPMIFHLLVETYNSNSRTLNALSFDLGALLFSYYLISINLNLLFFAPFLLTGYFIFKVFIINGESPNKIIFKRNPDILLQKSLLSEYLSYKESEYLFSAYRKNLLKKWFKEPFNEEDNVKEKIRKSRENLEVQEQELLDSLSTANDNSLKSNSALKDIESLIFGYGLGDSPSDNSKRAVLYGLFLSLPFTLQPIVKLVRETESLGLYPFLSVILDFLITISPWVLIAFIFGFFYHVIRGSNGLEKGLVFGFSFLFPLTVVRLLSDTPFLDAGHISYIFQNFTYVLLLGVLCFDFQVVRKGKYGWRELLSVYGFVTIGLSLVPASIPLLASIFGQEPIELIRQLLTLILGTAN